MGASTNLKKFFCGALFFVILPMAPAFAHGAGKLYILGGSMDLDNTAVWQGILADAQGGPIGVIPASSSSPESSANLLVETFEEYAPGSAVPIMISQNHPGAANDPQIVQQIRSCRGFYFTGGSQSRGVQQMLNPDGSDTDALAALRETLAAGGVIAGSSAGAALMSDPMITGGTSSGALEHGVTSDGVRTGPGLGFFSYGLTDQHFLRRGRMGRLIVATGETPFDWGFGIDENTGLVVDLETGEAQAIGAMGVAVIHTASMKTQPDGTRTGIVSHYLDTGDSWNLETHTYTPAPNKQLVETPPLNGINLQSDDIWDDYEAWRLLTALPHVADQDDALGHDPNFDVYLQKTSQTRGWDGGSHTYENQRPAYGAENVAITIVPAGQPLPTPNLKVY